MTVRAEIKDRLVDLLKEQVRFQVALARYTSFRIGGPADVFAEPTTPAELRALVGLLQAADIPLFVLGGGTNLLVSDKGVRGVVVKLGEGFDYSRWKEQGTGARVQVGAARSLGRFVREAVRKGYRGVEFAEGIPGSVGGGLLMNAGAFGGELSQVVETLTGVCQDGKIVHLPGETAGFAYRRTALPPGFIVTEITLRLQRWSADELTLAILRTQQQRQRTQPHGYPNAGSIFKNPAGVYAGQLIEAAGFKGVGCGHARVSERHANFIVNTGGARAVEVKQLMERIQRAVWREQRVWLEPEIRLVGEW